jgi:TRAP-type mannitol/chloroaromatic compound transport system permease small subunit
LASPGRRDGDTVRERRVRAGVLWLSGILDRVARILCGAALVVLAAAVLLIVLMRYGFGTGFIQLQDLAVYAFAILVIFSLPVCMAQGGHVRVEVFAERMGPRYLRRADALALVLFLIPVFGLVIWADASQLAYSWSIREASVETGGLPGLFLVKTALPVAAAMMILQGLAAVLRAASSPDGGAA